MEKSNVLVETKDLARTYMMGMTEVRALRGVSLNVERGEFVAIMGPSGSGKSTLMHLLGCLDRPSTGTYRLAGTAVEELSDEQLSHLRNRKVGFIFQAFNLISQLSIIENIEVPLIYMGMERSQRIERCKEMLTAVGLGERGGHRPNELSGGENQRAAIARALVTEPDLLFADEPTGNLDSKTGVEIMEILTDLHESGTTIILVTHEIDKAKWTNRLIQMKDGKVQRELNKSEINKLVDRYREAPIGDD